MNIYLNRLISFLALVLATVLTAAAAVPLCVKADSYTEYSPERALPLLSELKIMNGDPSGDFRLGDTVTRAEFSKIAVAASDYRNNVASQLSVSPFYDVPYTNWAAPYVRTGVTNNLISGYPDSSFRPDNPVTFEEAVTIMLRVLGYSDDDFGAMWPSGQIGMANSLEMTENLSNVLTGSEMTRGDVAILVFNTLRTKKKDTQSKLITIFDTEIVEDVTLISTSREDSSIPSDEVFTDSGSYKIRSDFDYSSIGMKGDIVLKNNKTVIGFFPKSDSDASEKYAVYSVLSDSVIVYKNGDMQAVKINNQTAVYDGKNKTTFAAVKSNMDMGDVLSIKRTGSDIDYIVYQKGSLDGPYTAGTDGSWAESVGLTKDSAVMRDGKACTAADIKQYDILYFVPGLNMAFAYSNKITGVYNSASPNSDNPTEVEVSGVKYKVEGSQAFKKLSSSGSFELGDTVTLLLGRTNEVADVLTQTAASSEVVGLITNTGSKTYTTSSLQEYSSYFIEIVTASGQTYSYTTTRDYKDSKNSVVRVNITDGDARISSPSGASISGTVNWPGRKIGSSELSDDVQIMDVGSIDKSDPALYAKIHPQRIDGVNLSSGKILYCHKNSVGKIDELILKDVTGDAFNYGIITSANSTSMGLHASGSYSYLINGTSYSFVSQSSAFGVETGQAVKIAGTSNPTLMLSLTRLEGKIELASSDRLTVGGAEYPLAENVQVYEKEYSSSTLYRMLPVSDIVGSESYNLNAFYDKSPSSGGRIRIIIAMKK